MNNIYKYTYLNNISDIIAISKNIEFNKLLNRIGNFETIVTSHLIHKKSKINSVEQFYFNLDSYISFLKNNLYINQYEIQIITNLTIYNKHNKILFDKEYYYHNIIKYENNFTKMFMYNYNKNISFLKKYININKKNFNELVNTINTNKKRSYSYFEIINTKNMNFYIPIIKYLEDIN